MGEANGLQWKDVDLDAGKITLVQAMPWDHNQPYRELLKTEKAYRSIPVLTPLRPMLEAGKATCTSRRTMFCPAQANRSLSVSTAINGCCTAESWGCVRATPAQRRHTRTARSGSWRGSCINRWSRPTSSGTCSYESFLRGRAGYGGAAAPGSLGYHDHPAHLPASAGEGERPVHRSAGYLLCEQKSLISLEVTPGAR